LTLNPQANGDTLLIGSVRDQAALHGLLVKVRDLGLVLVSVQQIDAASPVEEGTLTLKECEGDSGESKG
jgi:hypothetical protein